MGGILMSVLFCGVMVTNIATNEIHFANKRVRNIWRVHATVPFSRANGLDFTVTDHLYERACREGMHQKKVYIYPKPAYDDIATYAVQDFHHRETRYFNVVRCSGFPSTFYLRKLGEDNYLAYWQGYIPTFKPRQFEESWSRPLEPSKSHSSTLSSPFRQPTWQSINPYRT